MPELWKIHVLSLPKLPYFDVNVFERMMHKYHGIKSILTSHCVKKTARSCHLNYLVGKYTNSVSSNSKTRRLRFLRWVIDDDFLDLGRRKIRLYDEPV